MSTASADDRWAMIRRALAARADGRAMARSEAAIAHLSAQARHLRSLLPLARRCVAARSGTAAVEASRAVLDAVGRALSARSVTMVSREVLAEGPSALSGWTAASLCFGTGAATVGPAWPEAEQHRSQAAALAHGTVLCTPSTSSAGAVRAVLRVERGAAAFLDGPVLLPVSDLPAAAPAAGTPRVAVPADPEDRASLLADLARRNRVVAVEQRRTGDSAARVAGPAPAAGRLLDSAARGGASTAAVVSEVWAASDVAVCEFGAALLQLVSGGRDASVQTTTTAACIQDLEDAVDLHDTQRLMQVRHPLPLGLLLALDCDGEELMQQVGAAGAVGRAWEEAVVSVPAPLLVPPGHVSLVLGPEVCVRAAVAARRVLEGIGRGVQSGDSAGDGERPVSALHPTILPLPGAATPPARARVARFPTAHVSALFVACLRVDRPAGRCDLVYPCLHDSGAATSGPGGGAHVTLASESYDLTSCVPARPFPLLAAPCPAPRPHPRDVAIPRQRHPRGMHRLRLHHDAS